MNKKLKKFFLYKLASTFSLMPLFGIGIVKNFYPQLTEGEQDTKKEQTPITSEDLKKNEQWLSQNQEGLIDNFIKQVLNDIDVKLADISSKSKDNLEKKLSESFFWLQLKHYFIKNQDGIKKNPIDYGLNFLTPYIYSKNLELNKGNVEFEKESYSGIEWGDAQNSDYSKLNNVKTSNIKKVKNTLKDKDFQERIKQYFQGISSGYKQYLFDEKFFPEYKKNFDLVKLDNTGEKSDLTFNTIPNGVENISSWHDWIKNYFEKQSLILDLSLNQPPSSSQQPPQEQIDNAISELTGKPIDPSQNIEFEIRVAPDLQPYIKSQYLNLQNNEIISEFNQDNKDLFFFLNPINSRFKYEVLNVNQSSNGLQATVKITDFVEKSKSGSTIDQYEKTYTTEVFNDYDEKLNEYQKKLYTNNLYLISNVGISSIIDDFFKTVNVKNDFTLDQIKYFSQTSRNLIYNFFYLITKVFYNLEYLNKQKELALDYLNSSQSKVINAGKFQFLKFFKDSKIDNNTAWDYYYLIYFINLTNIKNKLNPILNNNNLNQQNNNEQSSIEKRLNELNITREEINNIFNSSVQDSLIFRQKSNKKETNVSSNYQSMIDVGKRLNSQQQILGRVAFGDELINQSNPQENSNEKFESLLLNYKNDLSNSNLKKTLTYVLLVVVLAIIVVSIVLIKKVIIKKRSR